MIECVLRNCFNERFRAAVSVLVGPCCPALLNCIDVGVHKGGSVAEWLACWTQAQ